MEPNPLYNPYDLVKFFRKVVIENISEAKYYDNLMQLNFPGPYSINWLSNNPFVFEDEKEEILAGDYQLWTLYQ